MKFDMHTNTTVEHCLHDSIYGAIKEIGMRAKARVIQRWELHMLRRAIRSERRTLARLTEKELEDIGICRADALRESQRRSSDLPDNRT